MTVPILPPLPIGVEAGKLFEWEIDKLTRRLCPLCGKDGPQIISIRPDKLAVAKCQGCSLIYLPEIPNDEDLSRFYNLYCEYKGYDKLSANIKPLNFMRLIIMARAHFGIQILNSFGGLLGHKLCEIGCSLGLFLQLARFCGANVSGIEIDQKASLCVRNNLNIPVFDNLNEINQPQDIICAFSVFEHLSDPKNVLKEIHKHCTQDGRLLLSMPNGGNVENAGVTWAGLRVDLEHINYFSLKSLSELLANCGFFVEQFWYLNQLHTNRYAIKTRFSRLFRNFVFDSSKYIREGSATLVVLARKV